jgi:hypothetical protein
VGHIDGFESDAARLLDAEGREFYQFSVLLAIIRVPAFLMPPLRLSQAAMRKNDAGHGRVEGTTRPWPNAASLSVRRVELF